eukprot:m.135986 g.135986  ORF g.135986 m.135986 type:complete len:124 (+) comp10343_c0_seq1:42-413(+)
MSLQDRPPKGGYGNIPYQRNIPKRGPPGYALFAGGAAIFVLGMYQINRGRAQRSRIEQEKINNRLALKPFLEAESDRKYIVDTAKELEAEAIIMRDNKAWKVGERVFNSSRFVPQWKPWNIAQ